MQLDPETLRAGQTPFAVLEHAKIVEFVRPYARPDSWWTSAFWFATVVLFVYPAVHFYQTGSFPLEQLGLGCALFFLLIPVHEAIHGVVYKLLGARHVAFKADFRKLVFYALADQFVVDRRELTLVAIMPFLIINTVLLGIFLTVPEPGRWIAYGALLLHTGGCFGDVALINFFHQHRTEPLVTFDNVAEQKSYFYKLPTTWPEQH